MERPSLVYRLDIQIGRTFVSTRKQVTSALEATHALLMLLVDSAYY